MVETTERPKWRIQEALANAVRRPSAEVIHMGPRIGVDSLDSLAQEILDAMHAVRVAEAEVVKCENTLSDAQASLMGRKRELLELQQGMFSEIEKLGVLSGPGPSQESE